MAARQQQDSDNLSTIESSFNTAESNITDSELTLTSNIHQYCRTRRPGEPERKGKAKIYYCKYCETGSSISTTGLRSHIRTHHKEIALEDARPTLSGISVLQMRSIYDRLYEQGQTSELDKFVLDRTINTKLIR
jgi:hypothetical protein